MTPNHDALHEQLGQLARKALAARSAGDGQDAGGNTYAAYGLAAWEVGKAIIALAGAKGLHDAFDYVEGNVGQDEAVWLVHRWAGLPGGIS